MLRVRCPTRIAAGIVALLSASCDYGAAPSANACEAMCDWAIVCHEAERPLETDAAREDCLEATYGADGTCEDFDLGALSFAGSLELTPCIDAVDERRRALQCDPFTGPESAIVTGTPPAQCIGAGRDAAAVFGAARDATVETGPALCVRVRDRLCEAAGDCATPGCAERLDAAFADDCVADGQYAPDDDAINPLRAAARACLAADALSGEVCEDELIGDCAAMLTEEQRPRVLAALQGSLP